MTKIRKNSEKDLYINTKMVKKAFVTGCFDLLHSGHIRFFEEASEYGELYVNIGNDKNIEY